MTEGYKTRERVVKEYKKVLTPKEKIENRRRNIEAMRRHWATFPVTVLPEDHEGLEP